MKLLSTLLANKHTSGAAVVYCAAKFASQLGAIWFPNHKEQFDQTTSLVESAAIAYGLVMAGDAKPNQPPTQNQ